MYIYIYLQIYTDGFACSLAGDNRYCHSALGGGAAFLHAALLVRINIVILLWGEALRPPPNPPSRFSFFQDTKTHLQNTSLYLY